MTTYFRIALAVGAVILCSMLAFAVSYGATTVEGRWSVNRLRGTTQVATHQGGTAQEAWDSCVAAIPKAQAVTPQTTGTVTHKCQTPVYTAVETFRANPAPVNCVVSAWNVWSPCLSGTQARTRTIVTQPANGGTACPALTETQACTVPAPAPTTWTKCADENQRCAFTGKRMVRYGAGSTWTVPREFDGGTQCSNGVFGDPIPNTFKQCQVAGLSAPPPDPRTGTASLHWEWTQPAGFTTTDFYLFYGSSPTVLDKTIVITDAAARTYVVRDLAPGAHYFALRAVAGTDQSMNSNIVTKVIQ
jgi:hypothetical protein